MDLLEFIDLNICEPLLKHTSCRTPNQTGYGSVIPGQWSQPRSRGGIYEIGITKEDAEI